MSVDSASEHGPGEQPKGDTLSAAARRVHRRVVDVLQRMADWPGESSLHEDFSAYYREFLALLSEFQQEVLISEGREVSCARGCASCCYHWVEDVNSFEAEAIAATVRQRYPDRVADVVAACESDIKAIGELDSVVYERLQAHAEQIEREGAEFDHVDVLLASFHKLRRPCPLLGPDGTCMVYDSRPITCRIYVSFSDPQRCDPDVAHEGNSPTALLDLEEEANALLDTLHFRFIRFEGDTGLRSLLARYLSHPPAQ